VPTISEYKCNKCSFTLPKGWGGYLYVIDDKGNRIVCIHPSERTIIQKVLGKEASEAIIRERTGYNSDCVCLDCLRQFELDIGDAEGKGDRGTYSWRYYYYEYRPYGTMRRRDKRICPKCSSSNVKTIPEIVGEICPKCKEGVIEETLIGMA